MKKALFLLVLMGSAVIPMVSFGAETPSTVPGCLPTFAFSPLTGQSCSGLPEGCQPGFLFSATTGKPCSGFPPGCSSAVGFSVTTGKKCDGSESTSEITELVKEIVKNTIPKQSTTSTTPTNETTPPPVKDVCPNLGGVQATVPSGMQLEDGNCVTAPEVQKEKIVKSSNFSGTTRVVDANSSKYTDFYLKFSLTPKEFHLYIPKFPESKAVTYSIIDVSGNPYSSITASIQGGGVVVSSNNTRELPDYLLTDDGTTGLFGFTVRLSEPATSGKYGVKLNTLTYVDPDTKEEFTYNFPSTYVLYGTVNQ